MFKDIFEQVFEEDNSPIDTTDINQFILYFSDKEFPEFKQLCKEAMKKEHPVDYQSKNASDILLTVLRKYYGNNAIETGVNGVAGQQPVG